MADQERPTPEQPTKPGDSDDHGEDTPLPEGADRVDRSDRDRDQRRDSGTDETEMSDPGGDSDPDPAR